MTARLHLRARGVPGALAGLGATALAAWWAGEALADSPRYGVAARVPVVALAPLVAATLLAPGLAGAEEELERSTPAPWRRRRALHAAAAAGLVAAVLAATALRAPGTYGALALLRGTAGCVGLVLLAAPVVGARAAWAPVCCWTAAAYLGTPREPGPVAALLGWPVLPTGDPRGWVVPLGALVLGLAAYARRGAHP